MSYKLDGGGATFLPVCTTPGCGWRGLPVVNAQGALAQAAEHERRAHPGQVQARNSLCAARRRTERHARDTQGTPA